MKEPISLDISLGSDAILKHTLSAYWENISAKLFTYAMHIDTILS